MTNQNCEHWLCESQSGLFWFPPCWCPVPRWERLSGWQLSFCCTA